MVYFHLLKNLHRDGYSAYARYIGDAIFKLDLANLPFKGSFNYEAVEYESTDVIFGKIESIENEIQIELAELRSY